MEVTRKNFVEEMENVKRDLSKCCFVGFDAEFTALLTGECFKHRYNEQIQICSYYY